MRQLFVEALSLGLAGGILGAVVGPFALEALVRLSPDSNPRLSEVSMDGRILAFSAGLSLAASLLFGTAPALQGSRVSVLSGLKEGPAEEPGFTRIRARSVLVALEYALAIVVLLGTALLARSCGGSRRSSSTSIPRTW